MKILQNTLLALCFICLTNLVQAQCNNSCAYFSYPFDTICQIGSPLYTDSIATPGGTFTINSSGLTIDPVSGTVYTSFMTQPGVYLVTYTPPAPCSLTCSQAITVLGSNLAFFGYQSLELCISSGATITPILIDTFFSSADTFIVSPPGLGLNPSTGDIDLGNSQPGTYSITRTVFGPCGISPFTREVSVSVADTNASFAYPQEVYCPTEGTATPVLASDSFGFFPSIPGLVYANSDGSIDLNASQPGTYQISYEIGGVCPLSLIDTIEILSLTDPSFAYSSLTFCSSDPNPIPSALNPGGTYSLVTNLGDTLPAAIDPATGEVYLDSLLDAESPYSVCYTPAATCTESVCSPLVFEEIIAPEIVVSGNDLEVTNVFGNLTWYLNGQVIAQNLSSITPTVNGTYVAELTQLYCSASDTLSFVVGSSEPVLNDQQVRLFPNPGSGTVNLLVDLKPGDTYSLELTNPLGQLLHREVGLAAGQREFDFSELPQGIYLFRILSESGVKSIRYFKR